MNRMILTVGLPASGKTTYARATVDAVPSIVNVNRDDIRFMLYGTYWGEPIDEAVVTKVAHGIINSVFKKGGTVIVSDTNLNRKNVRSLVDLAGRWSASVEFVYFDMDIDELTVRDFARGERGERNVGEDVIRNMANRYLKNGRVPRYDDLATATRVAPEQYVPDTTKPDAIIVDLDGTVALHNRSPYDYDSLHTDSPNNPIIRIVQNEYAAGTHILFTSGRPDSHRDQTIEWLETHIGIAPTAPTAERTRLLMRKAGDKRMDVIVKQEIFDAEIRDNYNVLYCLDDRNQVVDGWRAIGLTVLQVAPGDF